MPIIKAAEDFKSLDDAIVRNFDAILLTAMNLLFSIHTQLKESPYGDSSRQQKMADIKRKARALMMFAGVSDPILLSDERSLNCFIADAEVQIERRDVQ